MNMLESDLRYTDEKSHFSALLSHAVGRDTGNKGSDTSNIVEMWLNKRLKYCIVSDEQHQSNKSLIY